MEVPMLSHGRHLQLILPSKFKPFKFPPIKISILLFSDLAADQPPCPTLPPADAPQASNLRTFCSFLKSLLLTSDLAAAPPPCPTLPPEGASPTRNYSDLLPLCSSLQSLHQTREIHALALVQGLLPCSVSLSAALIQNYARLGGGAGTCRILYELTTSYCETTFLWNTLIRAYSILGVEDGLAIYNSEMRSGGRPDGHTFPSLLKTCADYSALQKGREIHGTVLKLGLESDSYVENTLLLLYSRCGDLQDAWTLFDEMPERDVVTWNTMIGALSVGGFYNKALNLFMEMKLGSRFLPNEVTIVSVLPVCAELGDELLSRLIHGYITKTGMGNYITVTNAMIDVYAKCGNVKSSRQIFNENQKNTVSWNAIITGFAHAKCYDEALSMFRLMVYVGERANEVTLSSMLPVLVELERFDAGKEIHAFSIKSRLDSELFIANSLIDMYAKSGHLTAATKVFNKMNTRNEVSWNTMIANFAQNSSELAAIRLIQEMQSCGVSPTVLTFTNLLPACARLGLLKSGKEIHGRSICAGFASEPFLSNALIDMYAKCNCLDIARKVFDISHKDRVSYNTLIVSYTQSEKCEESLNLFEEMRLMGMQYDTVSFVGAIAACANLYALKQGKEIHGYAMKKLLHTRLFVANSLLDLYTKCGRINSAERIFQHIPEKDTASWNTMVSGYGMLGEFEKAINLFEAMKTEHWTHDSISYIAVLSACSHGGLVDEGKRYFDEMKTKDVKPTSMHFACMIDLLGRAGRIHEAVELIKSLPVEPDAHIWAALLGVCRIQGNIELAKWATEHLFMLKPEHSGYYAQLSNMLSEAGRWEEANEVREQMKLRGFKKFPGCSSVQVRDHVHTFLVGTSIDRLNSAL